MDLIFLQQYESFAELIFKLYGIDSFPYNNVQEQYQHIALWPFVHDSGIFHFQESLADTYIINTDFLIFVNKCGDLLFALQYVVALVDFVATIEFISYITAGFNGVKYSYWKSSFNMHGRRKRKHTTPPSKEKANVGNGPLSWKKSSSLSSCGHNTKDFCAHDDTEVENILNKPNLKPVQNCFDTKDNSSDSSTLSSASDSNSHESHGVGNILNCLKLPFEHAEDSLPNLSKNAASVENKNSVSSVMHLPNTVTTTSEVETVVEQETVSFTCSSVNTTSSEIEEPFHNLRHQIRKKACCNCDCSSRTTVVVRRYTQIHTGRTRHQPHEGKRTHNLLSREKLKKQSFIPSNNSLLSPTKDTPSSSFESNTSASTPKRNRQRKSELAKLYDDLHEIKWAKHMSPDNILSLGELRKTASCTYSISPKSQSSVAHTTSASFVKTPNAEVFTAKHERVCTSNISKVVTVNQNDCYSKNPCEKLSSDVGLPLPSPRVKSVLHKSSNNGGDRYSPERQTMHNTRLRKKLNEEASKIHHSKENCTKYSEAQSSSTSSLINGDVIPNHVNGPSDVSLNKDYKFDTASSSSSSQSVIHFTSFEETIEENKDEVTSSNESDNVQSTEPSETLGESCAECSFITDSVSPNIEDSCRVIEEPVIDIMNHDQLPYILLEREGLGGLDNKNYVLLNSYDSNGVDIHSLNFCVQQEITISSTEEGDELEPIAEPPVPVLTAFDPASEHSSEEDPPMLEPCINPKKQIANNSDSYHNGELGDIEIELPCGESDCLSIDSSETSSSACVPTDRLKSDIKEKYMHEKSNVVSDKVPSKASIYPKLKTSKIIPETIKHRILRKYLKNSKQRLKLKQSYSHNMPVPNGYKVKNNFKVHELGHEAASTSNDKYNITRGKGYNYVEAQVSKVSAVVPSNYANFAPVLHSHESFQISEVNRPISFSEELLQSSARLTSKQNSKYNHQKDVRTAERCSTSQDICHMSFGFTFHYKGITVNKNDSYTQVILKPTDGDSIFLSVDTLMELRDTMISAINDTNCQVLIVNGSGKSFCSGLDLKPLIGPDKNLASKEIAEAIKDFIEALAAFRKPLVAVVNGCALGLGVTLLAYSDVVLASDSASFYMPYSKLGYFPEGAATLMLPLVVGSTVAMDMLLRGRKISAVEAHNYGLVSEVLHGTRLPHELVSRVKDLAEHPLSVMETTKAMLRMHTLQKLSMTLEQEAIMLPKQWLSQSCQEALEKAFQERFLESQCDSV